MLSETTSLPSLRRTLLCDAVLFWCPDCQEGPKFRILWRKSLEPHHVVDPIPSISRLSVSSLREALLYTAGIRHSMKPASGKQ